MPTEGIALGRTKGHVRRKREQPPRPAYSKGKKGPMRSLVKEIVRDVTGFAPYERRAMELLRNGADKRALRYLKRKLGTHIRAKRKREELNVVIRQRR